VKRTADKIAGYGLEIGSLVAPIWGGPTAARRWAPRRWRPGRSATRSSNRAARVVGRKSAEGAGKSLPEVDAESDKGIEHTASRPLSTCCGGQDRTDSKMLSAIVRDWQARDAA
jgi:hypothetical protein